MNNYNPNDNPNDDYLPERNKQDYNTLGPVFQLDWGDQINYWKNRAKFFENEAYRLGERLKEWEDCQDGEEWKHCDD